MESTFRSPLDQLIGKRRTYEDLSRFIGARATGTANYSLLLGAGCSVSSNIRSASELTKVWRKEIFLRLKPGEDYNPEQAQEFLTKNEASWYNPQREYSSLFEKNFDLPRQRRMFVEQEVAGKSPNLGYAYLVRLVEEGYLNTIFTTNFDDLVNEAFFQFSQTRPIVCAHDSSVRSITVTSKRPKVIKLHGDYLFDDIKTTVRETESLEDNTRKKFTEFCRDFGLIVVGYSGCDRSIMDVLQYLLRSDDYFKHGIYWCLKKGDLPSDELLKLLWRDRVYFVEIDGFDELMAELHEDLIGSDLPIDTGVVTEKPRLIINGFCENDFLIKSTSRIVKRDIERLKKKVETEELFSLLRGSKGKKGADEIEEDTLTERELITVFEIKQHLSSGDHESARRIIKNKIDDNISRNLKEELAELRVEVEESAGDLTAALKAVDFLIAEDPKEADNYIRKTFLTINHEERIEILNAAILLDPENSRLYSRKFDCLVSAYTNGPVYDRSGALEEIKETIEKCLSFDPSLRNPIWIDSLDFYKKSGLTKVQIKENLEKISEKCSSMGRFRLVSLRARLARWSFFKEDRDSTEAKELINDITHARLNSSRFLRNHYEWLELDAYSDLGKNDDLSKRISELAANPDISKSKEYLRRKSKFLIEVNGDIKGAISAIKSAADAGKSRFDIRRAASLMALISDHDGISKLFEKHQTALRPIDKLHMKRFEFLAKGDIESALGQIRLIIGLSPNDIILKQEEVHDLLLLGRKSEAETISKKLLDIISWNKTEHGEFIINYELCQQNGNTNKKRLDELATVSSSCAVKGCAFYLLGDTQKARSFLLQAIQGDGEYIFMMPHWAIFKDSKGTAFIKDVIDKRT